VNVASPAAMISLDRYPLAGYGVSKAGVVALTRELALQWALAESESTRSPQASFPAPPAAGSTTPTKSPGSPHTPSSATPRMPKNWTAHFSSSPATRRATSQARRFSSTEAGHAADRPETRIREPIAEYNTIAKSAPLMAAGRSTHGVVQRC